MKDQTGTAQKMWAIEGGYITDQRGVLVAGETGEVVIPAPCFLIQHERGLVLVDTGLVPAAAKDARAIYGQLAVQLNLAFREEHTIDRQIQALGFKLSDVDHVIMSHLHLDHTGGMYLFPHAQFYVMSGELQYAYWPLPAAPLIRREDIEPTRGFAWNQIEGEEFDLFDDGAIRMIHMPGHTPGNASVMVRLASRTFLLSLDTAHLRSGYEKDIPMPSDYSTLDSVRSIRRLRQLSRGVNTTLWITHDPEDWKQFKHTPEFYE
jgi:N-acyl homoserine lactone hydrolase